ncbi:ATP-binding protein [bacterium]|nr:ATP-binding protein [bacterium]
MERLIYLNCISALKARIDSRKGLVQVLLGPRQVGKTTSILKLIEDYYPKQALYVSADQVFHADREWLQFNWQKAQEERKILFIDEIQKSYNWSETIKSLYDASKRAKKPVQCVLLGSSSLQIQKGLSESLTGRFQLTNVYHWNYKESNEGYKLTFEEYLKFGGYPGSYQFINSSDWVSYVRNSIIATVIEKDILQYHTVKNPALFRQAFEILISYPAQEISYTKLLGQLQDRGNVELIKYYLSLYEGAFLIKTLDKYSNKSFKIKSSSPKILPMAPCLPYLSILDKYSTEETGRALELMVGTQLVRLDEALYYWREEDKEVDFVLKIGRNLYAIEVKSGRYKNSKGLEAFRKKFPNTKGLIITPENYLNFEASPKAFIEQYAL